jgi:hypothetical protein
MVCVDRIKKKRYNFYYEDCSRIGGVMESVGLFGKKTSGLIFAG